MGLNFQIERGRTQREFKKGMRLRRILSQNLKRYSYRDNVLMASERVATSWTPEKMIFRFVSPFRPKMKNGAPEGPVFSSASSNTSAVAADSSSRKVLSWLAPREVIFVEIEINSSTLEISLPSTWYAFITAKTY